MENRYDLEEVMKYIDSKEEKEDPCLVKIKIRNIYGLTEKEAYKVYRLWREKYNTPKYC